MLSWALTFLVIALIAGLLGFTGVAGAASQIAQVLFVVFLVLVWRTLAAGKPCPANPWGEGATTLEWSLSSPPPFHSFDKLPELT